MTIDIRARVYCSLGEIVQGSLSDTYVQGNGLVFCRGSVTLAGIYQPTLGQVVDFAYEKAGYLSRVPRRLRVLSSFADPLTRQTTIQLGCRLTMLEDLAPPDAKIRVIGRKGGEIIGYTGSIGVQSQDRRIIPITMTAASVAGSILTRLGITAASGIPLQSRFTREEFDLSQGFVRVLAGLLISENYVGYLNESEQLVFRSTTADGGAGPVLRAADLIALDSIGSGELPGEAIKVDYSTYRLNRREITSTQIGIATPPKPPKVDELPDTQDPDRDPNEPEDPDDSPRFFVPWNYEETIGSPVTVRTNYSYTASNGVKVKGVYSSQYIPYTQVWTEYNDDKTVKARLTSTRSNLQAVNGQYFGQLLNAGIPAAGGSTQIYSYQREENEYDPTTKDLVRSVSKVIDSKFAVAGRLSVQYYWENEGGTVIVPGLDYITTDLTITTHERARFTVPIDPYKLQAKDDLKTVYTGVTKTTRVSYKNYGATQEGQQSAAWNADNIDTSDDMLSALAASYQLSFDSSEVRIVNDPNAYKEVLPERANLIKDKPIKLTEDAKEKPSPIGKTETSREQNADEAAAGFETQALWSYSSGAGLNRVQVFSLPYARDDYYVLETLTPTTYRYTASEQEARRQALAFGRVQNRMLLGHRNGLSLQVAPELMPPRPFDPLYIDLDGIAGQYRVNGLTWAFDANGMACSIDAMFWGGVGTT